MMGLKLESPFKEVYDEREKLKKKDHVFQRTALLMAKRQEEIIREAINNEIGSGWKVEDLIGRLFFEQEYFNPGKLENIRIPKPHRTLKLDGKPILIIGDPEFSDVEIKNGKYEVKMMMEYKIINKKGDGE